MEHLNLEEVQGQLQLLLLHRKENMKITPAKENIISILLGSFVCVGLIVTPIVLSQDNSRQINNEDQIKLQTAYREWQDSAKTTEIMRLKFNSIALETIANMGLMPKDNDINIDSNGKFVVTKKVAPMPKKEQ